MEWFRKGHEADRGFGNIRQLSHKFEGKRRKKTNQTAFQEAELQDAMLLHKQRSSLPPNLEINFQKKRPTLSNPVFGRSHPDDEMAHDHRSSFEYSEHGFEDMPDNRAPTYQSILDEESHQQSARNQIRQQSFSERDVGPAEYLHRSDSLHLDYALANNQQSELSRIKSYMNQTKTDHPELQGPPNESLEDAVIRVVQTYQSVSASLRDSTGHIESVDKLKDDCNRAKYELCAAQNHLSAMERQHQGNISSLVQQIEQLNQSLNTLTAEKEQISATNDASRTELLSVNQQRDENVARYKDMLRRAHSHEESQAKHIYRLQSEMDQERQDWKRHLDEVLAEKTHLDQRSKSSESELLNSIKVVEEDFSNKMLLERAKYEEQIQELKNCVQEERAGLRSRVRETSDMFETRLNQQGADYEAEKRSLEAAHLEAIEVITGKHQREKDHIVMAHKEKIFHMQALIESLREESNDQKKHLQTRLEADQTNEAKWKQNVQQVEEELEKLQKQLVDSDNRLKNDRGDYEVMVKNLKKQYRQDSVRQREDAANHFQKDVAKYVDAIHKLKAQHKVDLDHQNADAEMRLKKQQEEHEKKVHEMTAVLSDIAQLKKTYDQQRPNSQIEIPKLKENLGGKPGTEVQQLRVVREEMRVAISREQYKGLRDHHIVARFRAITTEINNFSRVEWDIRREAQWPCSENNLLRLYPQNTRKLKQYIVQSSLWSFLFERIFRSPFCLFGPEGAEMDRVWEDIYAPSASLNWREVPPDVEERRCAFAKRCLPFIDPAVEPSAADDVKLKASYEMVVGATVETFCRLMENIALFGAPGKRAIMNIVRLCAKVWLEFCSQQYRVMVRLAPSSGNVLALSPSPLPSLRLVTVPELKRFGTIKGANLNTEEPVAGWKAVVDTYPSGE